MPRLIRHPEIRRAEILDQAFRIFLERGRNDVNSCPWLIAGNRT
ncbi:MULTISPECIES: hypothetical protein [Rhizobium]|nr:MULTISPECIES: hypothetical protein [Rhizobium]